MRNLHSILVATDLFLTGDEVLNTAARLSQLFGARIHLFHASRSHASLHVADFRLIERSNAQLRAMRGQLVAMGVDAIALPVEFGAPADVIVRRSEKLNVDLIVMGCGGHRPTREILVGPVTEAVIQRARQPVLAVSPAMAEQPFKKILCPVDHSSSSRRGLRNAIRFAQALGSEITVLSVVPEVNWLVAVIETGDFNHAAEQHDRHWRQEFDQFLKGIEFGSVLWRSRVRSGLPDEQIVSEAKEQDAGLIVMGATGRTGLVRALTGGVTRNVLRQLPCSILVVKDKDLIDEFAEDDARVAELLAAEGEALMGVSSFDAAAAKFDQVLAHNPFHQIALLRRADALQHIGEKERADRSRRRAAALSASMLPN